MIHDTLTTETIRKKFRNNFDLCNFAINIAQNLIQSATPASLAEILAAVEERVDAAKESKP